MTPSRREFLKATAAGAGALPVVSGLGESTTESERTAGRPRPTLRDSSEDETVLTFVGDLFLTEPFPLQLDRDSSELLDVLRGSDASFANLEHGLSVGGAPELGGFRYGPALRGHPSLATELTKVGVTAVSLANNHTGNFGPEAVLETMRALDSAGIPHAGAGADMDSAHDPVIVRAGARSVAFFSLYSFYYNFQADDVATSSRAGIAASRAYDVAIQLASGFDTSRRGEAPYMVEPERGTWQTVMAPLRDDLDRMIASVGAGTQGSDIAVLSVHWHWGRHTKADVPHQQRTLAHAAIDAGIDVFVGHGPHALRGVELYRGKPIFYSLSNFNGLSPQARGQGPDSEDGPEGSGQDRSPGEEAVLARVTLTDGEIRAIEALPFVIGPDHQPRFADGPTSLSILHRFQGMSANLGTDVEVVDGLGRIPL